MAVSLAAAQGERHTFPPLEQVVSCFAYMVCGPLGTGHDLKRSRSCNRCYRDRDRDKESQQKQSGPSTASSSKASDTGDWLRDLTEEGIESNPGMITSNHRRALRVVLLVSPPPFHMLAETDMEILNLITISQSLYHEAFYAPLDDIDAQHQIIKCADDADDSAWRLFLSCLDSLVALVRLQATCRSLAGALTPFAQQNIHWWMRQARPHSSQFGCRGEHACHLCSG